MVIDDDDADRRRAHSGSRSTTSSTSVPSPGRERISARPAVALHAADDRLADAAAVGGDGGELEAGATVVDEDLDPVLVDLGVDRDRLVGGELGGVGERLAGGPDERVGASRRGARRRRRRPRSRRRGRPRPRWRRPGAPTRRSTRRRSPAPNSHGAKLALLTPRQSRHLARVVGPLLHQGQGLEHGIVEVGGDLGPLLRADPLSLLGGEPAPELPQERGQDQRQRDDRDDRGQGGVSGGAERVVGGEEEQRGADHERDPEAAAVEVGELRARMRRRGAVARPDSVGLSARLGNRRRGPGA